MQIKNRVKTGIGWPHDVTKRDLIIEPVKGSGAGGQKRNKTCSGIRLTHIPTGISTRSDKNRKQSQNLKDAFNKLAEKLIPIMKKEVSRQIVIVQCKDRVRTYKESGGIVKDHRTNKIYDYTSVMCGNLNPIIKDIQES